MVVATEAHAAETRTKSAPQASFALPIGKLRGVPLAARMALKRLGITTCGRLLMEAGDAEKRQRLAQRAGIDPELLLRLVQRADLARVKGVGAIFGMMLEDLGIRDVGTLARQDPQALHAALKRLNSEERFARRAPTAEEVADWIAQARALPILVER